MPSISTSPPIPPSLPSRALDRRIDRSLPGREVYLRELPSDGALGALLYVHGLGESSHCFERLMAEPRLARWRQLALDLPGYGKSSWPESPLGLPEQAAFLVEWLTAAKLGPVVLVGHSMGGVIGQLVAERAPRLLRALVNVEGNISMADCTASAEAAAYDLETLRESGFEVILDGIYRRGIDDPALRSYYASLRMCDPRAFHRNSVQLVELSRGETLALRLGRLRRGGRIRIAYLLGSPRGAGRRTQALLAAEGVLPLRIDEAGHWPFLDQPGAFVDALGTFLDGLD